jgi:DNA invertase Pin-like site-specific DNA recombinase
MQLETATVTVNIVKIVAYYRVSTKRQGRSGLGLEAQKEMVRQLVLAHGAVVVAEYIEVETGKKSARPKLQAAIHHAQLTNATLVVAKLDRLARN